MTAPLVHQEGCDGPAGKELQRFRRQVSYRQSLRRRSDRIGVAAVRNNALCAKGNRARNGLDTSTEVAKIISVGFNFGGGVT
jgi:hypothetical protein